VAVPNTLLYAPLSHSAHPITREETFAELVGGMLVTAAENMETLTFSPRSTLEGADEPGRWIPMPLRSTTGVRAGVRTSNCHSSVWSILVHQQIVEHNALVILLTEEIGWDLSRSRRVPVPTVFILDFK